MTCSACGRFIFFLKRGDNLSHEAGKSKIEDIAGKTTTMMVYPKGSSRPPVPAEVLGESPEIAEDYTEACLVLADSPKASAALSRRCLQSVLRAKAGVTPGDLVKEIQEVLDSGKLPTHLADNIDAIRTLATSLHTR